MISPFPDKQCDRLRPIADAAEDCPAAMAGVAHRSAGDSEQVVDRPSAAA